jgi:betaine-aldehyde dehydrogenase
MTLPLHRTKIVATIGPASSSRDAESEAVALANDSEYGLATSVWTCDVDRPPRIARELQVGTVWVNDWVTGRIRGRWLQAEWRGRLRGLAALEHFLEYKHVVLQPGSSQLGG